MKQFSGNGAHGESLIHSVAWISYHRNSLNVMEVSLRYMLKSKVKPGHFETVFIHQM